MQTPITTDTPETGHVRISTIATARLRPSPENDTLYRPVDSQDPSIVALSESIEKIGLKEPIVVTLDDWIVSGHRRYAAARLAGLTDVPCRVEPIRRNDDPDAFVVLLREYNRQREKSLDEKLREEVISTDPHEAYCSLIEHRRQISQIDVSQLVIEGSTKRSKISAAKQPMLDAVKSILDDRDSYWPLSVRTVHYAMLNDPPLKHASKPQSTYQNTTKDYKNLVDLLARARVAGCLSWEAIEDPTRPVTNWGVHRSSSDFIRSQLNSFCKNYWRDLMQSQINHIEIVGEKNTIQSIIRPVAQKYCIPFTIGRGYCSLSPRREMAIRYRQSGKEQLVILLLSDFDPDGEEISHSFARSMRDDFGIESIFPVRVALTADQIAEYSLPPIMQAKPTSVHYDKFTLKHGTDVFELEALSPDQLQAILRNAIDSVIDTNIFNAELDKEKGDAAFIAATRSTVHSVLKDVDWQLGV